MNFVTFNQDNSHVAIGTTNGFQVYSTDPFAKCYETQEGNITLLEMLFSTSLVALVLSPRRLVITNTKRKSTICELTFPTTILNVRLNRKRLVVVLEDQIYLYDVSNMKLVKSIDTSSNPHGICALSPSSDNCFLAYPLLQRQPPSAFQTPAHVPPNSPHSQAASGHVLLFDALTLQAVNVIEAHRTSLSCISMNQDGTRLATASDKGTIIRVFSVPTAEKLFQFRRGSMPARIFSISFNLTSTLLCVSSATETVHIFRLTQSSNASESPSGDSRSSFAQTQQRLPMKGVASRSVGDDAELEVDKAHPDSPIQDGFTGMLRRTSQSFSKSFAATVGGYLPSVVSEMLEPARDFAWFKLPRYASQTDQNLGDSPGSLKSVVAMSSNGPQVMCATSEGRFLVFSIDLESGGEGTLVRSYDIFNWNRRASRGGNMED